MTMGWTTRSVKEVSAGVIQAYMNEDSALAIVSKKRKLLLKYDYPADIKK